MPLPLILPAASAIASGAASLATQLGIGAVAVGGSLALADYFKNNPTYNLAKAQAKLLWDAKTKSNTNIPPVEEALVLRPEYKTEVYSIPEEFIPFKSIVLNASDNQVPISKPDGWQESGSGNDANQDPKNPNNKKSNQFTRGFNKEGRPKLPENPTLCQEWANVGNNILYGIGRTTRFISSPYVSIPAASGIGAAYGAYKALKNNSSTTSEDYWEPVTYMGYE